MNKKPCKQLNNTNSAQHHQWDGLQADAMNHSWLQQERMGPKMILSLTKEQRDISLHQKLSKSLCVLSKQQSSRESGMFPSQAQMKQKGQLRCYLCRSNPELEPSL